MTLEPSPLPTVAEDLVVIPAGQVLLRDQGTKRTWGVEVGAFRLEPYPVTREVYLTVQGEARGSSARPRTPVTEVSWVDAVRFCNGLSLASGLDPCYTLGDDPDAQDGVCDWQEGGYRLPTAEGWGGGWLD